MAVADDLPAPVLDQRLLGDHKYGIHRVALEPGKRKVNGDLGLAEPLFVEDRGVGQILDSTDSVELVWIRRVFGREFGLASQDKRPRGCSKRA